ncbi:MAG: hypothetical protein A2017_06515 [Lentisphaerae bacterium GWF2_44_16]|nr:MAG: hypothetical protein A2017_06515 [Lentisphaerae bacterium GWF2_44_16]
MSRIFVFFLVFFVFISCFARIYETPEKCIERYGKATGEYTNKDMLEVKEFRRSGFVITCIFIDGKCHHIEYNKDSGKISWPEAKLLFEKNSGAQSNELGLDKDIWSYKGVYAEYDDVLFIVHARKYNLYISKLNRERAERVLKGL